MLGSSSNLLLHPGHLPRSAAALHHHILIIDVVVADSCSSAILVAASPASPAMLRNIVDFLPGVPTSNRCDLALNLSGT